MSEEYYRDEWPADVDPGSVGGSSGGGGGGAGGSGGSGGGGGGSWGGGGGSGTSGNWGTTPQPSDDGEEVIDGEWGGSGNVAYLKKNTSGYLLKHDNYLLTGTLHCRIAPQLIIWIGTDSRYDHRDCVLTSLSPIRRYKRDDLKDWIEQPQKSILAYRIDWMPGEFEVRLKWQSGHYPHASIGNMSVALFGVDLGEQVIPIGSWRNVATISIDEDFKITINGMVGYINGNAQYL